MLREGPLHAAVKVLLAEPGDRLEVPVGRFMIDLVRADGELVEVQTGGFGALGGKLDALLDEHRMRIVDRSARVDSDRHRGFPIQAQRACAPSPRGRQATGPVERPRTTSRRRSPDACPAGCDAAP